MAEKLNMLLDTARFSDLSTFLRDRDNKQALAEYVLDECIVQSFWKNLNSSASWVKLIYKSVNLDQGVWDVVDVYKNVKATPPGVWLPWDAMDTRQLAWNEDIIDFQYSRERVWVWVHRYAVAIKTIIDKKVLPTNLVSYTMWQVTKWWARQQDEDIFTTLFRDYPVYYSETASLSAWDQIDRVLHLFGRWTQNDVWVNPEYIYAWTSKSDVEPWLGTWLADTDTLNDVFVKRLNALAATYISMRPISLEDNRNFYGLICEQEDIDNFYANASATVVTDITNAFQGKEWKSPVFTRVLWEIFGIRFFQYDQIATADSKGKIEPNPDSDTKFFEGTPLNPQAFVLWYYIGTATTITWLRVWTGWDSGYTTRLKDDGADATYYYLLLSRWARHLPYFSPAWSTTIWVNSYNKFAMTATIAWYAQSHIADGDLCGRLQIWGNDSITTNFKVLYTWPVFVGTLKIGSQNDKVNYIDTVYRIRMEWLAIWNAWSNLYDAVLADAWIAAWIVTLKASLGITSNLIEITSSYRTLAYVRQRRAHVFNTVRSLLFWWDMLCEAQAWGSMMDQEKRDYGATEWIGMSAVMGKKLVTTARWTINSYAVVVFKRPEVV